MLSPGKPTNHIRRRARLVARRPMDTAVWDDEGFTWVNANNFRLPGGDQRRPPWALVICLLVAATLPFVAMIWAFYQTAPAGWPRHSLYPLYFLFNPVTVLCLSIAYCLTCSVGWLMIDHDTRRWTIKRGLWPSFRFYQGSLDSAGTRLEMTTGTRGKHHEPIWILIMVDAALPPSGALALHSFDLDSRIVSRDVAWAQYRKVAARIGLPLIDSAHPGAGAFAPPTAPRTAVRSSGKAG